MVRPGAKGRMLVRYPESYFQEGGVPRTGPEMPRAGINVPALADIALWQRLDLVALDLGDVLADYVRLITIGLFFPDLSHRSDCKVPGFSLAEVFDRNRSHT